MSSEPPATGSQPTGRYPRVLQILNQAAGDSKADYQGVGRFWNLPLADFLTVVVCQVRMIAPAAGEAAATGCPVTSTPAPTGTPCCHAGPKPPPPPPVMAAGSPGAARGARSGLIIGLKGAWPFDGTQFPRLPWGGQPVAAGDIDFISRWIDDGCPESEASTAASAELLQSMAEGATPHPVSIADANVALGEAGKLQLRQNIEHLGDTEIANLRHAIGELIKLNAWPRDMRNYYSWAQLHGDECPHGWSTFLPWHRMYLRGFEQALQDIIPSVTLPYWSWSQSTPQQIADHYIPKPYRCAITENVLASLTGKVSAETLAKLRPLEGQDFTSITFLNQKAGGIDAADQPALVTALKADNPLFTDLRYPGEFQGSIEQQFHHHYPTPADVDRLLAIETWREFGGGLDVDQSFGVLDMDPHNTMHIWIGGLPASAPNGGDMLSNLTAAFDPIFWAHHGNVDRLWAQWQSLHPGVDPLDLDDVLQGVNATVEDSLSIRKLGYEYAADTYVFPTDPTLQIQKFVSGPAGVLPGVIASHRKAEVRLHSIRQPQESFIVRVFLNQPGADISTPIDNNPHYAGHFALFGHGACIGGPGHCDPRRTPRRPFDQRPPHHNDPWNVKMDVTDTVQRLVAAGEKDLQVNLVVVAPKPNSLASRLRMNAVSLTFHD